jgi:hypothetical protein
MNLTICFVISFTLGVYLMSPLFGVSGGGDAVEVEQMYHDYAAVHEAQKEEKEAQEQEKNEKSDQDKEG